MRTWSKALLPSTYKLFIVSESGSISGVYDDALYEHGRELRSCLASYASGILRKMGIGACLQAALGAVSAKQHVLGCLECKEHDALGGQQWRQRVVEAPL
jgi:hypothetical protein